jgi:hypothetical protein
MVVEVVEDDDMLAQAVGMDIAVNEAMDRTNSLMERILGLGPGLSLAKGRPLVDGWKLRRRSGTGLPITLICATSPDQRQQPTATPTARADADYADYADSSRAGKLASRHEPGFFG